MQKLSLDNIQLINVKRQPNRQSAMKALNRFHEATLEMAFIGMCDDHDYQCVETEYTNAVQAMLEIIAVLTDKEYQIK